MHIPIKSERQRQRALRILLEVERLHVGQCECIEICKMLRELREEIAWVRGQRNRKRFRCRDLLGSDMKPSNQRSLCGRETLFKGPCSSRSGDTGHRLSVMMRHFVNLPTFTGLPQQPVNIVRQRGRILGRAC